MQFAKGTDDWASEDWNGEQIPQGLWWTETTDGWGSHETPFMFFRNKSTANELAASLPALLLTLPSGGGVVGSVCIPMTEAEQRLCDSDCGRNPGETLSSSRPDTHTSTIPMKQKISFPLYAKFGEIEDILVERTLNSIRINLRFVAPHAELKATLQSFLISLHNSLARTFTLAPYKEKASRSPISTDSIPLKYSLTADAWRLAWCKALEQEPLENILSSQLAVSLFRKRPLESFDLSLIITTQHVALFPVEVLRAQIIQIMKNIQKSVLASARYLYWRSSAIGVAYLEAFDREVDKLYRMST